MFSYGNENAKGNQTMIAVAGGVCCLGSVGFIASFIEPRRSELQSAHAEWTDDIGSLG